jgi:hypothetical protein
VGGPKKPALTQRKDFTVSHIGAAQRAFYPLAAAFLLSALLTACGGRETQQAPPAPNVQTPSTATPEKGSAQENSTVTAHIITEDLQHRPLGKMIPIVTRQPNAFDQPISHGEPTNANGEGSVVFSPAEHVYLRAWDPAIQSFANNFYEILPGSEMDPTPLKVQMVPGARLSALLRTDDPKASQNTSIALKMSHPTRGPWWPAQANSDEKGFVEFPKVPAGKFDIVIEAPSGAKAQLDGVMLSPDGNIDLGEVTLR